LGVISIQASPVILYLGTTIENKGYIIGQVFSMPANQAIAINMSTRNTDGAEEKQAIMINKISTDSEKQAEIIGKLTTDSEKQAEINAYIKKQVPKEEQGVTKEVKEKKSKIPNSIKTNLATIKIKLQNAGNTIKSVPSMIGNAIRTTRKNQR
jgi:hypothetical protein